MFLCSAVSSLLDQSNRFTFYPLADVFVPTYDLSGKHSAAHTDIIARRLFTHIFPRLSVDRCSFIQLSELRHYGENKIVQFLNGSQGDSNPPPLIESKAFYH